MRIYTNDLDELLSRFIHECRTTSPLGWGTYEKILQRLIKELKEEKA